MINLEPVSGEGVNAVNTDRLVMIYRAWEIFELTEGVYFASSDSKKVKPLLFGFGPNANEYTASEVLEAVLEFIEGVED